MALRPGDILKRVEKADEETLTHLERIVDSKLRDEFDGNGSVQVDLEPHKLRPAIKQALLKRYRAAGWTATINEGSCQRDGTWCYLVLTASGKH